MPGSFSKEEAHAYLDSRPGWMMLTTVGQDGYPHTVPVGYFRVGDELFTGGRSQAQRLKNIVRNPKVSALFESGSTMQDIKGLLVQGDADVVTEPSEVLPLLQAAARQRGTAEDKLPTEVQPGASFIRIRARRYLSWDYSRGQ